MSVRPLSKYVALSCTGTHPSTVLEIDTHMPGREAREQSLRLTPQSLERARQSIILALGSLKRDPTNLRST